MDDAEVRPRRIVVAALCAALLLATAAGTAFALLHHWHLPPGGQQGSAALVNAIPSPRLQSAPQIERAQRAVASEAGQ